jgi:Anti-sigma-K factor rskA/Putative zinc-finger
VTANDIHLLTGAYVLDSLDDADREVFVRHLDECEGCAGEVAELRETVVRLADDSWAVPPPRLRQNVMDRIRHTRQLPPVHSLPSEPAPPTPPRPAYAWRKRAVYGLAAAILAVVAGGGTYLVQQERVRQAEQARIEAAQRQAKIDAVLTAPDATVKAGPVMGGGRVTVVASPSRNAAVVLLADASNPGPQKAYEFWMIEKGSPRPAALLSADKGSGAALIEGIGNADTLGMTLEKASGATVPTEPILAAVAIV